MWEIKEKRIPRDEKRGITSARIRVPGGRLDAKVLGQVQRIAEEYGNGEVHLTIRQGFEIFGIPFEKVPEVNKALQPIIDALGINQFHRDGGYDSSGTRNIMACVGNHVCPFANYDTTALAKRIERPFSLTIYTSKWLLQGALMTVAKYVCMTLASSA